MQPKGLRDYLHLSCQSQRAGLQKLEGSEKTRTRHQLQNSDRAEACELADPKSDLATTQNQADTAIISTRCHLTSVIAVACPGCSNDSSHAVWKRVATNLPKPKTRVPAPLDP